MDLLEHAAGVWAHRLVVLAVGLVAAASVFVWRASVPDEYTATATVQVRLPDAQTSDPSVQVGYYADTVTGLAGSRAVLERALGATGRTDDPTDLADDVTAETGTEPGFVTVSATAETGPKAAELADAMARSLSQEVADEQAADLAERRAAIRDSLEAVGKERREVLDDPFALAAIERERETLLSALRSAAGEAPWRLAVVDAAEVPDAPAAPHPLRDALLALIIALVLAAEGVVLTRAFRGSLSVRDPARDAGEAAGGVPGLVVGPDVGPTAVAPVLPALETARSVAFVQHGPTAHARTASLLARLLAARGDDVLLADLTPRRASLHKEVGVALTPGLTDLSATPSAKALASLPVARGVRVLTAGRPQADEPPDAQAARVRGLLKSAPQDRVVVTASVREIDDLLEVSAALDGPTVLEVDAGTTRKRVRDAAASLRGLGLDVVAVAVRHDPTVRRRVPDPDKPAAAR